MTSGDAYDTTQVLATLEQFRAIVQSATSTIPDDLRAAVKALNALDAFVSVQLKELALTRGFEVEDASSLNAWAGRELRLDAGDVRSRVKTAHAMHDLPEAREAAAAGHISGTHSRLFAYSLQHVGHAQTQELESSFVEVARTSEPAVFKKLVRHTKAVCHPESLDEAWIRGMDRRDLTLAQVGDGWHVNGFLPIETGAKFKEVLTSLAVPREADDLRTASQRRVDGLDEMLTRVLADGLPTDGTVAPQIHVTVDVGTLRDAFAPGRRSPFAYREPAQLVGFGPIGDRLLTNLVCGSAVIPYLVETVNGKTNVLDVGRRQRDATTKQRRATWLVQGGVCARDHCRNSIDHIHHKVPWSHGGATDLDNLVGLCKLCHTHIHARDGTARRAA